MRDTCIHPAAAALSAPDPNLSANPNICCALSDSSPLS